MTKLILSIYISIALVCAFVIYVELSIITSNTCIRYFIAMYDDKVVDERLGIMPDYVKESFGKTLDKFGRSYVENYKNSTKDYVMMIFTSIFLAILPILNVLLLVTGFKIYRSVIELGDRAEAYVNREVVD